LTGIDRCPEGIERTRREFYHRGTEDTKIERT
jgi:hypothetical protein